MTLSDVTVTLRQIAEACGVTEKTAWTWTQKPDFPKPYRLSRKTLRWKASEIEEYIRRRKESE